MHPSKMLNKLMESIPNKMFNTIKLFLSIFNIFKCWLCIKRKLNLTAVNTRLLLYTLYFISSTFISNARLKMAKTRENAKQHPEAELSLFENYSIFIHVIIQN